MRHFFIWNWVYFFVRKKKTAKTVRACELVANLAMLAGFRRSSEKMLLEKKKEGWSVRLQFRCA
jgi:hypothetical protein